jgi:predicted O-methyltransferase YrrM
VTKAGEFLAARGKRSVWGGLYFDGRDAESGSVTEAEAQLLYAMVCATKPEVVVEIGTSYGYSTIHLAQGLKDNGRGHLYTAEIEPERVAAAIANVDEAGLLDIVTLRRELPKLERIDLAFLDAAHDEDALRDYLTQVSAAKLVVVHDAAWQDHLAKAIAGTSRTMVMLPTDSFMKMAVLQ